MKRVFRYWSYKEQRWVPESEVRERLGLAGYTFMATQAILEMEKSNVREHTFLFDRDSPYRDWLVEEMTGRIRHKYGVWVFAALICVAMAIIGLTSEPVRWVKTLFAWIAGGAFSLGSILVVHGASREWLWLYDIGWPLVFAGSLICLAQFFLAT